jgi:hypothetical protein
LTFVTYFDEIKPDAKAGRHEYVVGGLVIPFGQIKPLEKVVSELAVEIFGTSEMTPLTEFHAAHIYFGKGAFKGKPAERRIEVLSRLGGIIHDARAQGVGQVYGCANSDLIHSTDPAKTAFAFFCERVQAFVGGNADTLLIGDLDGEESRQMIRDFSRYRIDGKTPWDYGAPIPSIIDSVHFAHSHHSRLLQLADAYLFLLTRNWGSKTGWMLTSLNKACEGQNLFPDRYKEWPKRR